MIEHTFASAERRGYTRWQLIRVDDDCRPVRARLGALPRRDAARTVTLPLELLALAGLIVLNAFFVAAEYSLVTSRRTRIMELDHQGNRQARRVLGITSDPPRFIAAMQLGVTITSLAIGALGEQVLAHRFDAGDGVVPRRRSSRC